MAKKKAQAKPAAPDTVPDPPCGPEKIASALLPLAVAITEVRPDPDNSRLHPEDNIQAIKESLLRFGQDQPLVVQKGTNIVRKGNGRLKAAQELGWERIAVVYIDEDNIDAAARAIADNRTAELAKWDHRVLAKAIVDIQEMRPEIHPAALGFTTEQVERLRQRFLGTPQGGAVGDIAPSPSLPAGGEEEQGTTPLAHVRMVSLYYDTLTYPEFSDLAARCQGSRGVENLADLMLLLLREEAARLSDAQSRRSPEDVILPPYGPMGDDEE